VPDHNEQAEVVEVVSEEAAAEEVAPEEAAAEEVAPEEAAAEEVAPEEVAPEEEAAEEEAAEEVAAEEVAAEEVAAEEAAAEEVAPEEAAPEEEATEEVAAEEVAAEEAAPEEEASETVPVNRQDGLGALVRAVEVAEAELAVEDAGTPVDTDAGAAADMAGAESAAEAEIEVEIEIEAEIDAGDEVVAEGEVVAEPVTPAPAPPVEDNGMNWYVIHTYSGYERKVQQSLEERVRTLGLEEEVAELLIPTEDVVEMKGGRKVVTAKKFFPGYLLIRMAMNEDLWHVVKNTPRVTGFVGAGRKPIPLPQDEVDKIVNRMEESVEAPKPKFQFSKNETVRIIDGPFTNFTGKVEEVDARRSTLKVMVSIFGRNTPVELDFFQVEKV